MKYSVGDEFPEVIFNWMDDNFEVQKAGSSELFNNKKIILTFSPHHPEVCRSFQRSSPRHRLSVPGPEAGGH